MTICVAVKVPAGLVLASDSASSLINKNTTNYLNPTRFKVLLNQEKIFQIGNLPIGVMSWGISSFNDVPIKVLLDEFSLKHKKLLSISRYDVEKISHALHIFLLKKYQQSFSGREYNPFFGLFCGGYSYEGLSSESYCFRFQEPNLMEELFKNYNGVAWFGDNHVLNRIIKGYGDDFLTHLINSGVDEDIIRKCTSNNVSETNFLFNNMSCQDAVLFASFCVKTTIDYYKFVPEVAVCGGDIDVCLMTFNNFKWVNKRQVFVKED